MLPDSVVRRCPSQAIEEEDRQVRLRTLLSVGEGYSLKRERESFLQYLHQIFGNELGETDLVQHKIEMKESIYHSVHPLEGYPMLCSQNWR